MADMMQDLLALKYSPNFDIQGTQEANIDLSLPPVSVGDASVYGVVTDGTDPIANATVKLFDESGLPYQHTLTDASGAYVLEGVPAGSYSIGAVKTGYRLSAAVGVTLAGNETREVNLTCTLDATLSLGAIAGAVSVSGGTKPLSGAKITLQDSKGTAIATTYTIDDGEFTFYDVADGDYTLISSAEGYLPTAPMSVSITGGSISNVLLPMEVDARTYNGTVSGIIRDQSGNAVAGCFVGLYRAASGDTRETLVATTKTNAAGKYLFGGVTGGAYLVKAKLSR